MQGTRRPLRRERYPIRDHRKHRRIPVCKRRRRRVSIEMPIRAKRYAIRAYPSLQMVKLGLKRRPAPPAADRKRTRAFHQADEL